MFNKKNTLNFINLFFIFKEITKFNLKNKTVKLFISYKMIVFIEEKKTH